MQLRYRFAVPLVALSLALAFSPALAAKPAPVPLAIPGGALPGTAINGTSSACSIGQTTANAAYIWFFPSDDYYYTFFDPATCGCGPTQNYVANWALFWQVPCQIQAQVWILPAQDLGGGCYVPVTAPSPPDPTNGLCNSAVVTLDGSAGGLQVHSVPLPAACNCLQGPFFVMFKIIAAPGCPVNAQGALDSPAIVVDASPDNCVSYNAYPGSGGPIDMVPGFGFPGNTTMWVDVDCCITPTLPGTWGKLKTLYR